MPEGDTIHKLAAALAPHWVGQAPQRVELKTADGAELSGRRIRSVTARGKHLLVAFEHGITLRTHLGMYGSWHRYSLAEPWQKPRRQASATLVIGAAVYVCFNAKECEILRTDGIRERTLKARLSVDLLERQADLAAIPARAREFCEPDTLMTDVLLDQRVACGIGNVYKSELLFLHRVHPLAPLGTVSDALLLTLYRNAAVLLDRNLRPGPRVTRFENDAGGRLWVYRRAGLPCFECGSAIHYRRCGKDWRSTYWCPACQPDTALGVGWIKPGSQAASPSVPASDADRRPSARRLRRPRS
ncbi:DNA-formamidopyrimidine glycosylase family protein [Methylolobus aquaticus]